MCQWSRQALACVVCTASAFQSVAFKPYIRGSQGWPAWSSRGRARLGGAGGHSADAITLLPPEVIREIASDYGTPTYVYDDAALRKSAAQALAFPNAYGLTVRYAMKASPNAAILKLFSQIGLHIDASSGYEVDRAIRAGVPPEHISLSTQELPLDFQQWLKRGVKINACSISQLERVGQEFPGQEVGIRFNPGLGSGSTSRTNVGGPSSSFGIWHELVEDVKKVVGQYGLKVVRIHTHIGSGSDPAVWQKVASLSLALVKEFPEVVTLNLGGGYKVGRMPGEQSTDLQAIGGPVRQLFHDFESQHGRMLHLEIEPGTYLVANAGALVARVQDKVMTSEHTFLKLDAGMTEILRPSLYGAQHPILIVPAAAEASSGSGTEQYVVVGHCCESGDLLTTAQGRPDELDRRPLAQAAIGDLCLIGGAGAYCAGMSTKNYNSFPEAAEVLHVEGSNYLMRRRQTLTQIVQNEVPLPVPLHQ